MSIIKKIKNIIDNESALGLVEALISLAVVGTAMVVITRVSLRTIKQARKNELQDIAVQAAVEAMDFMKQPGTIVVEGDVPVESFGKYYRIALSEQKPIIFVENDHLAGENEIANCDSSSSYYNGSLGSGGYDMCQQIYVKKITPRRYDLQVIMVWQTVGGEFEKKKFDGYRIGEIEN